MIDSKRIVSLNMEIVVVGAGVIGLTAARALLLKGCRVTVLAKHVPGDNVIFYASNWAGAMWAGVAHDHKERSLLKTTYHQLVQLARTEPDAAIEIVKVKEYFDENPLLDDPSRFWFSSFVENWEMVECGSSERNKLTCSYDVPVIDSPLHLQWLKDQVTALGGIVKRQEITSLDELYAGHPQSAVIINASGLGSRTLGGVIDLKCHPVRGQNMLVRSDNTSTLYYRTSGEEHTHIIPRPRSNLLVCGGVFEPNKVSSDIDAATLADEIRRVNDLAPHVVSNQPDIVTSIIGIRPGREGGYRLEHEIKQGPRRQRKHILHAYGHGHNGYSVSYATADALVKMLGDIESGPVSKLA